VKRIKDLKTRPVGTVSVPHDAPIAAAVDAFMKHGISSLIVYQDGRLAGIFTKNDLVRCCSEHREGHAQLKVADYMTRDPYTVEADANLDDVAEQMIAGDFRHVPVLDGEKVIGMVTPIDILFHQKTHLAAVQHDLVRYIQGIY